ncbi:MAG TPA: D-tyrosyl-tRNA(Tyr) deacylase [Clostridiaceae bacterium]|nr:D-tyrosyl-tRNA(Tyr) deacylase [Clostridiaceae bacterium]
MRAVVQRVREARVSVDNKIIGEIGKGLVVLLGVGTNDTEKDLTYLADKILNLRVFEDENGKMNISLMDVGGELLIVSQFTLYGDCRRGNRPSYTNAAPPAEAEDFYNRFVDYCKQRGVKVETGKFQAEMLVEIHNDGPVTILIDSKKEF